MKKVRYESDMGYFDGLVDQACYYVLQDLKTQYLVNNYHGGTSAVSKDKFVVIEEEAKIEIELQYFKKYGKYYTSGKYKTKKEEMFDILDEVKEMKSAGTLPGINKGDSCIIYINTSKHPKGYPLLLV